MIKVVIVEDHELYRMGLSLLLQKADDIDLVSEAADGLEGLRKVREFLPDVVLMDIGLPNMDGIEATQKVKELFPDTKVLIITSRNTENDVLEAFRAGADGYIMKDATPEQTITAIKAINEGVGWLDPAIAKLVYSNLHKMSVTTEVAEQPIDRSKNIYGLTERELAVLSLMTEGLSNPQIADELVIAKATAKAHVHSILQKLNATTRTQATVTAMKEGLV